MEGFASLGEAVSKRGYPSNPKSIFTSNAYFKNDLFKYYAASRVDSGALYFIGQHGGGYGVLNQNSDLKIIRDTSDKFLTWGWRERESDTPVGVLKPPIGLQSKMDGNLLLVQYVGAPIEFRRSDHPIGAQGWFEYFEDQVEFFRGLIPEIQQRVKVRLHPHDPGYEVASRWKELSPDITFDHSRTIAQALQDCRIVVPTYPQTTFLESLSEGFPTVMFFRESHWRTSQIAKSGLDGLRESGIVFHSPTDAAIHINRVWTSTSQWWTDPQNKTNRLKFCEEFSRRDEEIILKLSQVLLASS